ncbi:MAG: RhuM family protein [Akkermansia sp.]|nr:RhuM family protein [Akkermansia sp.]
MNAHDMPILMYQTEDGQTRLDVHLDGDTVWLTIAQMAELFQKDRTGINRHINNILEEGELSAEGNVQSLQSDAGGRPLQLFSLDMVIAVGYRVKSLRGTQFRVWANRVLKEYLQKGFAMNDHLLKSAGGGNYFRELLERIRDIRSSEKVFWRQVLDIYATSMDYSAKAEESRRFFKVVQNKMIYAATGQTAAELVVGRADAALPLMGMTSFKGDRPTLQEAQTAKNYLQEKELSTLNYLVSAFLDLAELQALRGTPMYMKDWIAHVDDFLRMSRSDVLDNAGRISRELADRRAAEEFSKYKQRLTAELSPVEFAFVESLRSAEKQIKKLPKK